MEHHNNITGEKFMITGTKFYVPTLSKNDNIIFLENIMQGLERTIYWNKYRFEIITQTKKNHLDYMIPPNV